jgi:ABC-type sugar transport system ATPase subunit
MSTAACLLEMRGIAKKFAAVTALDAVDFEVRAGEVHALVGENGAGKSTLIKILSGALAPDAGAIILDGAPVSFASPRDAQAAGIATIHQELTRIPELSIAENLFLGREPRRWYGIDWRAMSDAARKRLADLGLELDVEQPIGTFSPAVQQMVAIARALDLDARVLVLDEPTASLDRREADALLEWVESLVHRGIAAVFIGHRLDEVFRIAHRITVLRDGARVGTFAASAITRTDLVAHMLGRTISEESTRSELTPERSQRGEPLHRSGTSESSTPHELALSVRSIARGRELQACDVDVARGEIVGVAGLLGSGRSELLRAIFGAEAPTSGTVAVRGAGVATGRVRASVERGLAYAPEERQVDGVLPTSSVLDNILLVVDRHVAWRTPARRRSIAESLVRRLGIACASIDQPARGLSGGNQQKMILARWIAASPAVLLLDEPTRGVDVGARAEIECMLRELAREGLGVLWVSSSLDELLEWSDRVLVLHDRKKVAELGGDRLCEDEIVRAMSGAAHAAHAPNASTERAE